MPQLTRTTGTHNLARSILVDTDTHALPLLTLFLDRYTTDGLYWDPQTIEMEIEDDFQIQLPPVNFDKLMAAITVLTTDDFFWSLPDFIHLCNIFSNDTHSPETFDPADSSEIAWGIVEAMLIAAPEDENPFKPEIIGYISETMRNEGIINPPDVLKVAQQDPGYRQPENFSDDPVMFEMIYKFAQQKTEDVEAYVKNNLRGLVDQMSKLPLVNGNVDDITGKMKKFLSS